MTAPHSPARSVAVPSCYVHPGQVAAFAQAVQVSTVLGSCVAICLYDDEAGIGGLNHFVLPDLSTTDTSTRYAGPAFRELLTRLRSLGARSSRLQAKVFGGSDTLGFSAETTIGARNVESARALLALAGIPIVGEDVGGTVGRKLLFDTSGGAAWVRLLGQRR
jgi:chemotaxis receptor (MCP) glutamine deamidase CheD